LFGVFAQLGAREGDLVGAAELLEKARSALRQDELHVALAERLRELAVTGQRILSPPAFPSGGVVLAKGKATAQGAKAIERAVADLESTVRQRLAEGDAGLELILDWQLVRKS
jgi:hypothetical protein